MTGAVPEQLPQQQADDGGHARVYAVRGGGAVPGRIERNLTRRPLPARRPAKRVRPGPRAVLARDERGEAREPAREHGQAAPRTSVARLWRIAA
jgi:hypothetical protein